VAPQAVGEPSLLLRWSQGCIVKGILQQGLNLGMQARHQTVVGRDQAEILHLIAKDIYIAEQLCRWLNLDVHRVELL
jgi:hypothetical protein